jgi:hypothetical protein
MKESVFLLTDLVAFGREQKKRVSLNFGQALDKNKPYHKIVDTLMISEHVRERVKVLESFDFPGVGEFRLPPPSFLLPPPSSLLPLPSSPLLTLKPRHRTICFTNRDSVHSHRGQREAREMGEAHQGWPVNSRGKRKMKVACGVY